MTPSLDSASRPASEPLRGLVDGYLGYRIDGLEPSVFHGLPSRHQTFIVGIGAPIVVLAQTDPTQAPHRYRCVLSGLQASPALIAHGETKAGIGIGLTPLGTRALFGVPAAALWNRSYEASEIVGGLGDELWERVQAADGWSERFDICDEVLVRGLRSRRVAPEVAAAWQSILASGGRLRVDRLSELTGYSRQHLTRRFAEEFGLGPKLASRVVRFEQARRALRSGLAPVDVAARCGYADQAHLSREWRELSGGALRDLLGEKVPFVQDTVGRRATG